MVEQLAKVARLEAMLLQTEAQGGHRLEVLEENLKLAQEEQEERMVAAVEVEDMYRGIEFLAAVVEAELKCRMETDRMVLDREEAVDARAEQLPENRILEEQVVVASTELQEDLDTASSSSPGNGGTQI